MEHTTPPRAGERCPVPPVEFAAFDPIAAELVELLKMLADHSRLRIVYALTRQPELHVRACCELLAQSQPAVSHHLAMLRNAGLIARRREGKHNYYALVPERFAHLSEKVVQLFGGGESQIRLRNLLIRLDPTHHDGPGVLHPNSHRTFA